MHVFEPLGECPVHPHRERAAGGREDGGLRRRDRRDEHRDDEHPAERPEQTVLDREEEVVGVVGVAQPRAVLAESGVHHRGDRDAHVGDQQQHAGQERGEAGDALGVLRLLVQGQAGVPTPVDEEREEDGLGEPAPRRHREGVQPLPFERRGVRRGSGEELHEGGDHEDGERPVLDRQQQVLDLLPDLHPAPAHPRHRCDERDGDEDDPPVVVLERQPEHGPEVDAADLGEVREHDHAGHGHAPSAHPAHPGPERLGAPGEGGAAVGDVTIELAIGEGDEQHRDERDDERDRRLCADRQHHESQAGHERVHRSGGGQADDGGAPQPERSRGE
ncbi:hypothetical protein ABE10_00515, partial [Bacillus toyonensis]|nr:hypothetical protein [Bacillus toyonensis]